MKHAPDAQGARIMPTINAPTFPKTRMSSATRRLVTASMMSTSLTKLGEGLLIPNTLRQPMALAAKVHLLTLYVKAASQHGREALAFN